MINLQDVEVAYPSFEPKDRSLRQATAGYLGAVLSKKHGQLRALALNHVNVSFGAGERVAIFGKNGSGKSTFLKVAAGFLPATAGMVRIKGNVTALTDFTYGMDFDLAGSRNIILRLVVMGYSFPDAKQMAPQIAEYSGLGEYIGRPVRTYSTGMVLRLAFAIATHERPQILLLDEMIGTADKEFQARAQKRLDDYVGSATLLLLATHDRLLAEKYCERGLVLSRGEIVFDGPVHEAASFYWDIT